MERLAKIARLKTRRVLGLMSGTSCDGIDACLVAFTGRPPGLDWRIMGFQSWPYPKEIRKRLLALGEAETIRLDEIPRLNFALGELFARVAASLIEKVKPRGGIHFVASHGHTIRHLPEAQSLAGLSTRSTFQIGEAAVIAEKLRCPVVSDFRPGDIAAGGQGAPLVAYVDRVCFSRKNSPVVLLNLGGIANLSILPPLGSNCQVQAFDTGPGNMLMDAAVFRVTKGRLSFDRDGKIAALGTVHSACLRKWLRDPYVRRQPPKTTGRERYGRSFLDRTAQDATLNGLSDADWIATLTRFTAAAVAVNLKKAVPHIPSTADFLVCGGGAYNPVLMDFLAAELSPLMPKALVHRGIDASAKEAFSFALLGDEALGGQETNVPSATGAAHGVRLGKWTLPPLEARQIDSRILRGLRRSGGPTC